ncbi:hypothetical protein NliqN6_5108 [Naganishia liquefaciens]|uniref:Mitochondrial import inner membrane translocase subunit TIM50 n=1 Tax=Naganishia liquefaciens TaxID=104408 RepID=A0A8H3YIL5_9TREE|nr:hypothetical protein NliqN6_5108 [Naganishia liquefaciens]
MFRTALRRYPASTRVLAFPKSGLPPSGAQPTPAERPSDVPDSISFEHKPVPAEVADKFEPIVNDMSKAAPEDAPVEEPKATTTTPAPLEPPAADAIPDKPDLSSLPSLDIDPGMPASIAEPNTSSGGDQNAGGKERTGARAKHSMSSIDRRWRTMRRLALAGSLVGGGIGAWYLANKDEPGMNDAGSAWERFKNNASELTDYFNKPAFDKLLPDPLPAPHQRPYTLLVDLDGMLVASSWDRTHGWRTAKRPGVDYFLAYLSQFYEIVLFTSQPLYTAMPVAEKLDPFQAYLPYKLYRESTRYIKGKIVKDLSYLNRDLSKVILLDTNPEHAALQPENCIIMPKWEGQAGDHGLVDYIPFLESIGIFQPPDVRPIIKAYEGKNIPIEYAQREAERKQAAIEEWEREHGGALVGAGAGSSWLSKAFSGLGGKAAQKPTQPMTYLEQKRAQAQKLYQEEQEYWRQNADEIKRLMEEDRQKQMAEMKGSLMGMMPFGQSASGASPAEGQAQPGK